MRNLPRQSVLLLALVTSVAIAKEREPEIRNVTLPDEPGEIARPVFVAGTIATVLRFEKEVDPARTEMTGWKGRFEPLLMGSKKVIIEPLYDLTSEDRFPLVVTLVDGTQVPFTIQAAKKGRVDHQVNLYLDRESDQYLRARLENALQQERLYREKAEQYEQEENSQDHAFATLLMSGAAKQTPFIAKQHYVLKDAEVEVEITVFSGKGKAAAVVRLKNHLDQFWSLTEARLMLASALTKPVARAARKCAVRMTPRSISPGSSGAMAIVADKSAFVSTEGPETLVLQLIRHDGLVQAFVMLDPSLVRE
jgi:hypothetical protein